MLDAVKDIAGLAVAIIIVFVAVASRNKLNNPSEIGKLAVKEFALEYNKEIELRYNSKDKTKKDEANEDEDSNEEGNKYLFIIKNKNVKPFSGKVTFIPVNDLKNGILDIRVSKTTLKNKDKEGEKEEIDKLKLEVRNSVLKKIKECNLVEQKDFIIKDKYNNNSAITIDFDEENINGKKYKKIILNCIKEAYKTIKEYK